MILHMIHKTGGETFAHVDMINRIKEPFYVSFLTRQGGEIELDGSREDFETVEILDDEGFLMKVLFGVEGSTDERR